jgi:putative ABC transport system permease protein
MPQGLTLIIRSIQAGRFYSVVSVAGLAIAITAVILVGALTRHELAYENHFANADRIYRLNWINSGTGDRFATMFNPFSPPLAEQTVEIEAAARVGTFEILLGRDAQPGRSRLSNYELVGFVDPAFFRIFDFGFASGEPGTALDSPNSIVITRAAAEKYFPGESAIGKAVVLEGSMPMTVSAVLDEMPASTHFPFHFMVPLDTARELFNGAGWLDNWGSDSVYHYVLAQEGAGRALVQRRIDEFAAQQVPYEDWDFEIAMQALRDIHFMPDLQNEMPLRDTLRNIVKSPRQKSDLALFIAGAAVLVLIASFNFMNLQVARGVGRSKQLGLLKVVGATRIDVFRRMLAESLLFAFFSLLVAAPLTELTLGLFGNMLAVSLGWADVFRPAVIVLVVGLTVILGLVSGAYPAWLMASQKPSLVLKGQFAHGQGVHRVRNVLVLLQFTVSIILIAISLVIYSQIRYSISAPLGFDAANTAIIQIGRSEAAGDYETLRLRLLEHPQVSSVTRSSIIPTGNLSDGTSLYPQGGDPDKAIAMRMVMTDFDFFETFGMNMAAGRGFSRAFPADEFFFPDADDPVARAGIVINEATARRAGWSDPADAIGKVLQNGFNYNGVELSMLLEVIGVVEDVHFRSLRSEVVPMIFYMSQRGGRMAVKISEPAAGVATYIERVWGETVPEIPLQMEWLDESVAELYDQETRTLRLLAAVSMIAIAVACLGLFAVASLVTELRRKEVALHKVFGATLVDIINLLSWRFLKAVLLANVLALPIAWLYLRDWLTTFVYRIELGPEHLLIPAIAALLVAWATVAAQAWTVARRSPIHSLRYE